MTFPQLLEETDPQRRWILWKLHGAQVIEEKQRSCKDLWFVEPFKLYYDGLCHSRFPSCRCVQGPRQERRVRDWRLYPSTCLGEQVQGEHLPFAHCSVQGHPSSALHCWHWWRCGLHWSGCYLHQSHCGPLSGLSFEDCFILPNWFFSGWIYGLAVQGSLLEKGKVGAQRIALQSWLGLSVSCGVLTGVGLVMPCCLAFCLSFCVFSHVLFQFDSCSCILAMLIFLLSFFFQSLGSVRV